MYCVDSIHSSDEKRLVSLLASKVLSATEPRMTF